MIIAMSVVFLVFLIMSGTINVLNYFPVELDEAHVPIMKTYQR